KVVLNSSHLYDLRPGTEDYQREIQKNRKLEDIASKFALEVSYINLSEYHKSGALLSCMVMHLNRQAYQIALTDRDAGPKPARRESNCYWYIPMSMSKLSRVVWKVSLPVILAGASENLLHLIDTIS